MKNVMLFFVFLVVLISCQNEDKEFTGIGEFNIGETFLTMPIAKDFTNVMEDEYNLNQYKFKEFGSVSDLNVTTADGKISEVSFETNDATNTDELDAICKKMIEYSVDESLINGIKYDENSIKMYFTPNKKVYLIVVENKSKKLKNGQSVLEYNYQDDIAMQKNVELIKQMVGIKK